MTHPVRIPGFLFLALLAPTLAQAQTSIRGYTRDEMRRPIAGVEVLVQGITRSVFSNASGYFVFDSLPAAEHRITARLPGYAAARIIISTRQVAVAELELRLEWLPQVLDSVAVVATRRGLYGVVGDSALQPIAGARVRVYGGGTSQPTDSAGRFAFPAIRAGDYLVEAAFPGLVSRPLHVTIPRQGSREVVLFLRPPGSGRGPPPGALMEFHDLGLRLASHPSTSRVDRGKLARYGNRSLCDIAEVRTLVMGAPTIHVDGVRELKEWPLCSFNADELALIELTCTAPTGRPNLSPRRKSGCIRVWTR